jgi:hypothetical protein
MNSVQINYNLLEPVVYKVDPIINDSHNVIDLYHKRLLHINKDYLIKTINVTSGLKRVTSSKELSNCDLCYYGKFNEIVSRKPLDSGSILTIFDVDIAGPFNIPGLKGERYFVTITCRASRAIWIYPIKFKSDVFNILVKFCNRIETQFNILIKVFRIDNAKELTSSK